MRTAALVLACSGCVITAPDGASQEWPPRLRGTIESVVSGDLDANGSLDVVVVMSGTESQAGLYLLKSNVDLVWHNQDPAAVVHSFSTFVPVDLVHPVAAYLDDAVVPRLLVASGADTLDVKAYGNTLEEKADGSTTVPGGGSAWIAPITFPGDMQHYAISNGSAIDHVNENLGEARPLPPLNSPSWAQAQTAMSYDDGASTVAVVATATTIYRCAIPTTPGTPFSWETVRTGPPWAGQTTYDFTGDGRDEIIGYDVAAHELCVVEPAAAVIPVAKTCITLPGGFTGTDVTIISGQNLSMSAGLDVLVSQASATGTNYSVIEDVMFDGTTLIGTPMPTIMFAGPARGRTVVAGPGAGLPVSILTFGEDGTAVCALGPC